MVTKLRLKRNTISKRKKHKGKKNFVRGMSIILSLSIIIVSNSLLNTQEKSVPPYADKLSELIEAVVIAPGAGEHIYEVNTIRNKDNSYANARYTDLQETSDIVRVINNLKQDYPNLKKISLAVGWFGDNIEAGKMHISPKAENKEGYSWQVGAYTRESAPLITKDQNGNLNWSGTPTDRSVVELCNMLNNQGIEVTLFPMLFIDTPDKPWRGHIVANSTQDVENFFKEYNSFVLHYASLEYHGVKLRDIIKGFLIASEMESLTKYQDCNGKFPAVDKLIDLAARVRAIIGKSVKISYAANWSEYSCSGDWHHLDDLWADKNIDYIGIDAYFPIKMAAFGQSDHLSNCDPYVETKQTHQKAIAAHHKDMIACSQVKDIKHWWKSYHLNPNHLRTAWKPKMKPITFTEIGFAAIDNTIEAPYKYLDRNSPDKGLPPDSQGIIDPKLQYEAIKITLNSIKRLLAEPDSQGIIEDVFWYNVNPKGPSIDWIHNHELKIADYEKGEFTQPVFNFIKTPYPNNILDFLNNNNQ